MPSNRGRIEDNIRAFECGQPRAFGIPLVPADQSADPSNHGIESAKAQIARCEVELLVVSGIIRYVHLAIDARDFAFGVDDGGAVVIQAGGPAFKDGSDDCDFVIASDSSNRLGRRPGHRFREIEQRSVFALAEILGPKQLGQADDLGTEPGRLFD